MVPGTFRLGVANGCRYLELDFKVQDFLLMLVYGRINMFKIIVSLVVLLSLQNVYAQKRKTANVPNNLVNCGEILAAKKIKSCTELLPVKDCKGRRDNLVKKGELWMDEMQSSTADEVYVISSETCLDILTDFAEKAGCCGG